MHSIGCTPGRRRLSRRLRRAALTVVAVISALGSTALLPAPAAYADGQDCSWPWTCGTVENYASAQMRIATIQYNPSGATCSVFDPFGNLDGRQRCYWTPLASGRMSPSSGRFKDVDAFTFPNTSYYWNGLHIRRGVYVRIRGGHGLASQHVECYRATGFAPRCYG